MSRSETGLGLLTVLVYEFVTGGGWSGREVPASLLAEGDAMRRAISEDFAALPGVNVVACLDRRRDWEPSPGIEVFPVEPGDEQAIFDRSAEVDYTVLIAPETDGVLARLTRSVARAGGRSIGSSPDAVELTTDKARLAGHFEARGIPTPRTIVFQTSAGLPSHWDGPVIIKPIDGAGSLDTFVVSDPQRLPDGLGPDRTMLAQPFMAGIPRSASFLVDRSGQAMLLGVGRQRIEVDPQGKVQYQGGTLGDLFLGDLSTVERAVRSVPGLGGFVGVDFLDDADLGLTVLEINPRPTTSYVGLSRMLSPGAIAGAWLDAIRTGLAATGWPERMSRSREISAVRFRADGTIETGEPSP